MRVDSLWGRSVSQVFTLWFQGVLGVHSGDEIKPMISVGAGRRLLDRGGVTSG